MVFDLFYKGLLLFALSGYLAFIMLTDRITGYIHPRFISFTWFAVAGFVVMGAALMVAAFRSADRPARLWVYLTVLAPLLLGFAVPPATFGADLVARQGINLVARQRSRVGVNAPPAQPMVPVVSEPVATVPPDGAQQAGGSNQSGGGADTPPAQKPSGTTQTPVTQTPSTPAPAPKPQSGKPPVRVQLNDKNMYAQLMSMYEDPRRWEGATLEMTGFVFQPGDLAKDEFALVRLIVTCHVAHAVPEGVIAVWPQAQSLKVDTWYKLVGTVELSRYRGQETFKVVVKELVPTAQPKDAYVYP